MVHIATLTSNPAIDGSSKAETVQHIHKVRISKERFDRGGDARADPEDEEREDRPHVCHVWHGLWTGVEAASPASTRVKPADRWES